MELQPPGDPIVRERDILWCEALILALGDGIIDMRQMEGILHLFSQRRPEKTDEPNRPGRLPESPA